MKLEILLFLLLTTKSKSFNLQLIKDYQKFKNVRTSLVITCETTSAPDVITLVKDLQYDNTWINLFDISNTTDLSQVDLQNAFTRLSYTHNVICSVECTQSLRFFNEISKEKLFHSDRNWLMFSGNLSRTFDVLSRQNINSDAEITVVIPHEHNEYSLHDVYNPSYERQGQLNITQIAYWNYSNGLALLHTQTKIERRRDFGGITFQSVITVIYVDYVVKLFLLFKTTILFVKQIPNRIINKTLQQYITSIEDVHMDSIDRMNFHLFELIMEMFNFKMFVRRAHIWGSKQPNGTWHGSIGMINRSEVDIMISSVRWDNERYGVFDQTTSTYFFNIVFIFRHPKSVQASKVFISPLLPIVWYCLIGLGLVIAFGIRKSFITENKDAVQRDFNEIGNDSSYSNCILMVVGFFFQQGYGGSPLMTSSRICVITTLVCSVLIYQFYCSFIVGSLLIESPKTLTTIKKLLDSDLHIYVDEVPYIVDNFKRVREKSAVQLYDKVMAQQTVFMPLYKGLTLVKQGGYVYHTDASYAYLILKSMLTDSEICDLQQIQYQERLQCGPGVPRKSALLELIKISLRKIHETGILTYHWKIWMGHKPKCVNNDLDVVPVDIIHFSSALYALMIGVKISLGFLIGEVIIDRFRQRNAPIWVNMRASIASLKTVF